ncbi:hypothetical protein M0R45_000782 [Rubus argutus]|uniref:SET domain-containing protein n=1 Tax=Rubus argutus TaxID=59490 RepID=A0AAW1VPA5_RUBAR
MEMDMRAVEDIEIGRDITPPLSPLSFALHDSLVSSHCSCCFSPLPPQPFPPTNSHHALLYYCSSLCSTSDSPPPPVQRRVHPSPPHPIPPLHLPPRRLFRPPRRPPPPPFPSRHLIRPGAPSEFRCTIPASPGSTTAALPNACYRFLVSSPLSQQHSPSLAETPLRIVPGGRIESGVCSKNVLTKECQKYGPRVIVRSIRRINRGEEVTVTYTDLLQPKAIRQSELWSRYRFICSCRRCSASPLTYVDRALEEISAVNFNSSRLSSDISFNRDKATERLTDYVDDAIADYCQLVIPNLLVRGLSMYLHKVFVITSQRAMKKNRR